MSAEFLPLLSPATALERWRAVTPPLSTSELCPTPQAYQRILHSAILAPHALPEFDRATVDGYAVRAADAHGASSSLPAYLRLVGEVPMGQTPDFSLHPGECALIHTGGMLPTGADAVVMIEHTQQVGDEIEVLHPLSRGEGMLRKGEDLQAGQVALPAGKTLRAAEIGALAALGILQVAVAPQPRVALLASGDEIIPPDQTPMPGQIRDINSYTLASLIRQWGGIPQVGEILPDSASAFRAGARRALQNADVLVFSAGSSVSVRDLTAQTIQELGAPGVLVHGIHLRPGKPTILGVCDGKPVIGLPGNPVSAFVVASLFLPAMLAHLSGASLPPPAGISARLTSNLNSQTGREDWVAVQLENSPHGWLAHPVHGSSNQIFTLARADGLICIPPSATGLPVGAEVWVRLFSQIG